MECLDLPAHGVPVDFLDGLGLGANRQVRDELPLQRSAADWRSTLLRVQNRQRQRPIQLLLANGCKHLDASVPDLQGGIARLTPFVAELHAMQALHANLCHFVSDRVIAITGQSIDAGSHQEAGIEFIGQAEQLIDVALAVADMDATLGVINQGGGLPQVQQPLDAFLLLDRNTRRVDFVLQRGGALELLAAPELDRAQAQWQSLCSHRKAGVHQDAAGRVQLRTPCRVAAAGGLAPEPNQLRFVSLVRELGGVLKDEQRAATGLYPITRRLEVPGKNALFVNVVVRQKAIGRLGVGPVLAREGNRAPDAAAESMKQASQSLAQSRVAEFAPGDLAGYPGRIVQ